MFNVLFTGPDVVGSIPRRYQQLNRLAAQLGPPVSEDALSLLIYQNNLAGGINNEHCVRRGLEERLELAVHRGQCLALVHAIVGFAGACCHVYLATSPPSTGSAVPVTNDDSSLARNTASAATSSGVPMRPTGSICSICTRTSGDSPIDRSTMGVWITPGQMAFTRTLLVAYSSAAAFVSWIIPPLDAQ